QPGKGRMFINDVGGNQWEEVNVGMPGANYGWPTTEGYTNNPNFVSPIFAYPHQNADLTGCAITGGNFYNPTTNMFPPQYHGQYFFHDYCAGWIMTIDPDTHVAKPFMSNLNMSIVDLTTGQDGALYYVSRSVLGLWRISYTPANL